MINIHNYSEWFHWSLVRYLHPSDHHPSRIRNVGKNVPRELSFQAVKRSVKIRDIRKIDTGKKDRTGISYFGYENKEKYLIYVLANTLKRDFDLLLIVEQGKKQYVLVKNSNKFMYECTLHYGRKPAFSIAEMLKSFVNKDFKINGKQMIKMSKKGKYVRFETYKNKIKSTFMICVDFESILILKDNGKQHPDESYANKYQ